jgi:hypothetical protein
MYTNVESLGTQLGLKLQKTQKKMGQDWGGGEEPDWFPSGQGIRIRYKTVKNLEI